MEETKQDGFVVVGGSGAGPTKVLNKVAKECSVEAVTVFTDRAEVTRAIEVDADEEGQYDVVVTSLTDLVVADSLRVSGTGPCRILEVSYQEEEVPPVDKSSELSVLQSKREEAERRAAALTRSKEVIESNMKLIETFASGTLAAKKEDDVLDVEYVERVLDMRSSRLESAAQSLRDLDASLRAVNDEIAEVKKAEAALTKASGGPKTATKSKSVTLSIEITARGPVLLHLVYLVSGKANWQPSYDLRVDSKTSTISLTYYGRIMQNTGEDWKDTRLTLSTANPGVGGTPPEVPVKKLVEGYEYRGYDRSNGLSMSSLGGIEMLESAERFKTVSRSKKKSGGFPGASWSRSAEVATARVSAPVLSSTGMSASATFLIDRIATIDSDDKPHKVTIAMLTLPAVFRHYCVPKAAALAYVQALCVNSSAVTLLASGQVNVFFDNNFVAMTSIQNVSPGETFRTFLGVDAAVRIDYRDFGPKTSQYGMFSKTAVTTHKFATTVRNTKQVPVNLVVADVLPTSSDSKIRVVAVEPSQSAMDAGTQSEEAARPGAFDDSAVGEMTLEGDSEVDAAASPVTDSALRKITFKEVVARNPLTNNLVWSKRVPAGSSVVLPFEYRVEAPVGVSYYAQ